MHGKYSALETGCKLRRGKNASSSKLQAASCPPVVIRPPLFAHHFALSIHRCPESSLESSPESSSERSSESSLEGLFEGLLHRFLHRSFLGSLHRFVHRSSQSSTHRFSHRLLQSFAESSRQSSSESSIQSSFQSCFQSLFESYLESCLGGDPYPWFAGSRLSPNSLAIRVLSLLGRTFEMAILCIGFGLRIDGWRRSVLRFVFPPSSLILHPSLVPRGAAALCQMVGRTW